MRICLLYASETAGDAKLNAFLKNIANGIASANPDCTADIFDLKRAEAQSLISYDYLVIGSIGLGFKGKLPDSVRFLHDWRNAEGKRCFCFVLSKGIAKRKALLRLMRAAEQEGITVSNFAVLSSPKQAFEVGKSLKVRRSPECL